MGRGAAPDAGGGRPCIYGTAALLPQVGAWVGGRVAWMLLQLLLLWLLVVRVPSHALKTAVCVSPANTNSVT